MSSRRSAKKNTQDTIEDILQRPDDTAAATPRRTSSRLAVKSELSTEFAGSNEKSTCRTSSTGSPSNDQETQRNSGLIVEEEVPHPKTNSRVSKSALPDETITPRRVTRASSQMRDLLEKTVEGVLTPRRSTRASSQLKEISENSVETVLTPRRSTRASSQLKEISENLSEPITPRRSTRASSQLKDITEEPDVGTPLRRSTRASSQFKETPSRTTRSSREKTPQATPKRLAVSTDLRSPARLTRAALRTTSPIIEQEEENVEKKKQQLHKAQKDFDDDEIQMLGVVLNKGSQNEKTSSERSSRRRISSKHTTPSPPDVNTESNSPSMVDSAKHLQSPVITEDLQSSVALSSNVTSGAPKESRPETLESHNDADKALASPSETKQAIVVDNNEAEMDWSPAPQTVEWVSGNTPLYIKSRTRAIAPANSKKSLLHAVLTSTGTPLDVRKQSKKGESPNRDSDFESQTKEKIVDVLVEDVASDSEIIIEALVEKEPTTPPSPVPIAAPQSPVKHKKNVDEVNEDAGLLSPDSKKNHDDFDTCQHDHITTTKTAVTAEDEAIFEGSFVVVEDKSVDVPSEESKSPKKEDKSKDIHDEPVIIVEEENVPVPSEEPKTSKKDNTSKTTPEVPVIVVEEGVEYVPSEKPKSLENDNKFETIPEESAVFVEEETVDAPSQDPKSAKKGKKSNVISEEPVVVVEAESVDVPSEEPKSAKKGKKSKVISEEPVVVVEEENVDVPSEEPKSVKKGKKSKVISEESVVFVEAESVDVPLEEPKSAKKHRKSKVISEEPVVVVEEEIVSVLSEESKTHKEDNTSKVIPDQLNAVEQGDFLSSEEPTSAKKHAKSKAIPEEPVVVIEAESVDVPSEEPKSAKKGKKSKVISEEPVVVVEEENVDAPSQDPKSAKKGKKSNVISEEPVVVVEAESVDVPSEEPKSAKKGKKSKVISEEPVVVVEEENVDVPSEEPKSVKKGKKSKVISEESVVVVEAESVDVPSEEPKSAKKGKKSKAIPEEPVVVVEEENGDVPSEETKSAKKRKKSNVTSEEPVVVVEAESVDVPSEEPKSAKKRKKSKAIPEEPVVVVEEENVDVPSEETKSAKKRKKSNTIPEESVVFVEEESVDAPPPEPKSAKKGKKSKAIPEESVIVVEEEIADIPSEEQKPSKKHKKSKNMAPEAEMVVKDLVDEPITKLAEAPTWKEFFNNAAAWKEKFHSAYPLMYTWGSSIQKHSDDIPNVFINEDSETHWQMILHKNKQVYKDFRKYGYLLDEELIPNENERSDENESDNEGDVEDEDLMDEEASVAECDEEEEDEEENLFDGEDLDDLENQLNALHSDDDESSQGTSRIDKSSSEPNKKYRKSAVDDQFFSLEQMEEALDAQENEELGANGVLDSVDDSWGGPADYKYEDFFGRDEFAVKQEKSKKRKRVAPDNDENEKPKKKKSIRWADEEQEEMQMDEENEEVEVDERVEEEECGPVLLGKQEDEFEETTLQKRIKKIKTHIKQLEEENLAPRSWELQGEVRAQERDENALLEKHVQFDANAKRAPEVTQDFTEKLENLIKQRCKDKVFDDVVRTVKIQEYTEPYRNLRVEDRDMIKQSLSEMYEKEYQKASGQVVDEEKKNPLHEEIQIKMKELFTNLDALSHYEYTPPAAKPEVKIVSNMAALRVEEVGAMASTEEQLLAPEETKKRVKGDLKASEERTKTDKLRERRKKKNRQHVMAKVMGDKSNEDDSWKTKGKKTLREEGDKKKKEKSAEKMRTAEFFSKLNETVKAELTNKTTKKDKTKKKIAGTSHKFVL